MGFEDFYGLRTPVRRRRSAWSLPTVSPYSPPARLWEALVAAACYTSALLAIFQVCFDTSIRAFWRFQDFLDVVCILNIFSRFYIGFQSHGMVILNKIEIRKHYLKSWFCIDVLSSVPFDVIMMAYSEKDEIEHIVIYCRMSCLLRIFRFFAYLSLLSQEPRINKAHLAIIRYSSLLTLLIHTCGCIWYSIACTQTHCSENRHCNMNDSWARILLLRGENLENLSVLENYIISLYWATIMVTEVEYGDILPQNTFEVIICILVSWLGMAMLEGMIVAGMSSLASNNDARRGQYYYRLKIIQKIMDDIGLAKEVRGWVVNYYLKLWDHYRGCVRAGLLDDLPFSLYSEIAAACSKGVLQQAEIFQGTDEGFKRALSIATHPYSYSPGQIILRQGQINQTLYCIEHGLLKVTGTSDSDRIATLLPGCLIGEVTLMYGIPRNVTISAATMCEILVLKRENLLKLFVDYPKAAARISRLARARCYNVDRPIREAFDIGVASHPKHVIFHKDLGKDIQQRDEHIFKHFMESVAKKAFYVPAAIRTTLNEYKRIAFWRRTIAPDSVHVQRWNVFVVCCQYMVLYIILWILLFNNNAEAIGLWGENTKLYLLSVMCSVDIVFVADIIFRLRVQVPSADGNLSDFRSIFQSYVRSREIYYDILSILPLDLFTFLTYGEYGWKIVALLRLNRLLWIRKLVTFMKNYESDLQKNVVGYLVVKTTVLLLFSSHVCAGIFYLCGCFYHRCDPGSWADYAGLNNNSSPFKHYMVALYWAANTMTPTGVGDIVAHNFVERIIAIITSLVGRFVYTYIVAQISATISSATSARVDFQNRLAAMTTFMKAHNLEYSLQKRVFNYMRMLWDKYEGQMSPGSPHLMSDLPSELHQNILMQESGYILIKVPFFSKIEEDFICELAAISKMYFYPPGEFIQYQGTIGRELFCILKGKCQVVSADLSRVMATFRAGVYFGETGFLFGAPDTLTVRAKTHCEILVLDYNTTQDILSRYPLIERQFEALQQNKEYYQALLQYAHEMESHVCPKSSQQNTVVAPSQDTLGEPTQKRLFQCCLKDQPRNLPPHGRTSINVPPDNSGHGLRALNELLHHFLFNTMLRSVLLRRAVQQNNRLFWYWEMIRLLLAVVVSIICSTQITFFYASHLMWGASYFLQIICWFDMYLHFHVAFYQSGKLVTDTLLTAKHYLQTNFLIDLIGCFPWEIFAFFSYSPVSKEGYTYSDLSNLHVYAYYRMPHMLQLYRLHLAFRYWQSDIVTEKLWLTYLKFLIYNAIFLHICSCLVLISVCDIGSLLEESPKVPLYGTDLRQLCLRKNWMIKLPNQLLVDVENLTLFDFYTLSIHFSTQMACNVGYADMWPIATETFVVGTLLMMAGALFYSWIIGSAISMLANADIARIQYTQKIQCIRYFLKNQKIGKPIYVKTVKFYSYKWLRTKGVEQNTLFDLLPSALLGDISTVLYAELIAKALGLPLKKRPHGGRDVATQTKDVASSEGIPLFRKILSSGSIEDLERNECFMHMLAKRIKPCLFRAHDDIVKRNDLGEEMYFIHKGEVHVLSNNEQHVTAKLTAGQYFGEWSLVFSTPRSATVRAATNCDLYVLEKKDLDEVMKYFPSVYDEIVQTAYIEREQAFEETVLDFIGDSSQAVSTKKESEFFRMHLEYIHDEKERSLQMKESSESLKARIKASFWEWMQRVPKAVLRYHNATIDPESKMWTVAQYIYCSFTLISFWSITYMVALRPKESTEYIICQICEIFLLSEIFLKFHIRYYDENGTYVHQYQAVSQHYLKSKLGFLFDMVCAFPIATFTLPSLQKGDISASLMFLSKASTIHIFRIVKVLMFIYEEEKRITINLPLIRLFKSITLLLVFFHVLSLLFIHATCPDFCSLEAWQTFIPSFYKPTESGVCTNCTLSELYVNGLYWVITRLTFTGYGKHRPRWAAEIWISVGVVLFGMLVISYIQGIFAATEANAYALQVSFEEKLQAVKTYMLNKKVPLPLQDRVLGFYNYLFARTHGVDYGALFMDTPNCLKREIFGKLALNLLKKQRLFSSLPETFLQHLSTNIKLQSYSEGEYLIQKGDILTKMFLIVNGKVMVSKHSEEGEIKEYFLTNGQSYGASFLFIRGQARETLQAKSYVNVLSLSKKSFEKISSKYDKVKEIFENRRHSAFSDEV